MPSGRDGHLAQCQPGERSSSFKAPPLRNVELTNPYFHDGGNLTLRQQVDFYTRGGNFPLTNKAHRDFLIMNLKAEDEALGAYAVPNLDSTVGPICDPSAALAHSRVPVHWRGSGHRRRCTFLQ